MFGSLGGPELLLILVLALLIFGPRKLPEIGRTVGKSLAEFRKASTDFKMSLEHEVATEQTPPPDPAPQTIARGADERGPVEPTDLSAPPSAGRGLDGAEPR